jgi:hypothetical protein
MAGQIVVRERASWSSSCSATTSNLVATASCEWSGPVLRRRQALNSSAIAQSRRIETTYYRRGRTLRGTRKRKGGSQVGSPGLPLPRAKGDYPATLLATALDDLEEYEHRVSTRPLTCAVAVVDRQRTGALADRPLRKPGTAGTGCSHRGRERKRRLSGA